MIDPKIFLNTLQKNGIEFFTGVPDSALKDFCSCLLDMIPDDKHIINANEGLAIGLAAGYHLATGKVPCVYMQNAGFGNAINPLLSLADSSVYGIPMLLLVGWRGEPGMKDEPQHMKQGRVQVPLLNALEINYDIIGPGDENINSKIKHATQISNETKHPFVMLVRRNSFDKYSGAVRNGQNNSLTRKIVIETILNTIEDNAIVVSTTGLISREIYECRERLGMSHRNDFLNVGAMGHTGQIALGIALQHPDRQMYCIDGDGAFLMHMGSVAIIGLKEPHNFNHIVLNNGAHESVGGQPTAGYFIDSAAIARNCGYRWTARCKLQGDIEQKLGDIKNVRGPALIEIIMGLDETLPGRPSKALHTIKDDFLSFSNDFK